MAISRSWRRNETIHWENNWHHATFYRNTIFCKRIQDVWQSSRRIVTLQWIFCCQAIAIRMLSTYNDNDRNLIEFTIDFACDKPSWLSMSRALKRRSILRGSLYNMWQTRESGWHRWLWFDSIKKCRLCTGQEKRLWNTPVLHIARINWWPEKQTVSMIWI